MMATNPRPKKARPRVAGLDREGKPVAATTDPAEESVPAAPKLTEDTATPAADTSEATQATAAEKSEATEATAAEKSEATEVAAAEKSGATEVAAAEKSEATVATATEKADEATAKAEATEKTAQSAPDPRFADTQTAITRPVVTATESAGTAKATRPAGSSPWRLAIGLGIAAAVFAVIAIVGALHPGASIGSDKAFIDEKATTELTGQAGQKACDVLAYNGTDFDKWAGKARSALTGKPLKEFNAYLPTQRQLIEEQKATADCKVDAVGVMDLTGSGDGAKAHVIMNLVISQSLNGQAANSAAPAVDLHMVRKGDAWLIEKIDQISAGT